MPVFDWFTKILEIPRPSGKEDKIMAFLWQFAAERHLSCKQDKTGNLLISKPATKGCENSPVIILQTHLDMVCEKHAHIIHDFTKDAISAYAEDGWIKAKGTTLGADDGIGIAAQLAVLDSNALKHGPIECLFTIEEETGLTGAFGLEANFLTGDILLNLDSEDDGELFIGCAGGVDTLITFPLETEQVTEKRFGFEIDVNGLKGGHSGDDINKGHANAIQLLTRFLWMINEKTELSIAHLDGGNLRNAIPREAKVIGTVPFNKKEMLRVEFNIFIAEIENELQYSDTGVRFSLESTDTPENVYSEDLKNRLLNALYATPHGVQGMSYSMPGLVETSTNLASIKEKDGKITIVTSQRSSVESRKYEISERIKSLYTLAGADVSSTDGYPGWEPKADSILVNKTVETYTSLFGETPKVRAIHAGLECGLFLEKYPTLDMVSFGPTIRGAHSPEERLEIKTVDKFWLLLVELLKTLC